MRLRGIALVLLCGLALGAGGIPRARAEGDGGEISELKHLSIEELLDLPVTSVNRYPEKLLNAAAAIEVISGDDIRRSGYTSIPDALRLADNLNVAQKNPHDWAISARGFNANLGDKLLVLIDGRSVYTPLFSGVFWNAQDYLLEDIDRIEVISGPGGTLWGANAVNGVINIRTKNARDTLGTYVEAGVGTELQDFGGARFGADLGHDVYLRVYGKYSAYDDGAFANGASAHDHWHQGQAGFRLDANPSPDDTLGLQGDFYSGLLLMSAGNGRLAGGNLVGHWSHKLPNDSEVSAVLYYDRTHLLDPFAASPYQPFGYLIDNLDTYNLDVQHRFWIGPRQQLVWGFGYRLIDDRVAQQAPNFGFFPANERQNLYNLFAQDEISLTRHTHLILGSKVEHNDYTGWEFEPTLRLRWSVSERQTLWAAISRAVRTPSRLDRDLAEPAIPPVLVAGSDAFRSETVVTDEVGYRGQMSSQLSASVSLYFSEYDHLRGITTTPVTLFPLLTTNSLEATTYGAEFALDYSVFTWWTLHAGYTWLHEDVRVKPGLTDFQNALAETEDPGNQISLRSSMDLPGNFEFNADLRWVDTLVTNDNTTVGTVPAYMELNLRAAWHPTQSLELSVTGQNLLHAQHPEYGYPYSSREELQRGVYAKASWRY